MEKLQFICAQPRSLYFIWQIEVLINNFIKHGIKPEQIHILLAINCIDTDTDSQKTALAYDKIIRTYHNKAKFYLYEDTRKKPTYYVSSIRPNILKQHFKAYPHLKNCTIFYHDCDMIFTRKPELDKFLYDKVWYLSDTNNYINYDYINSKGYNLYDKMCNIVGIDKRIPKLMNSNSGGAQYIMKNVDYLYWEKVETDCQKLYYEITEIMRAVTKLNTTWHGLQIWCADMWAILWNAWLNGNETKVVKDLDFSWPNNPKENWNKNFIFHNAGITQEIEDTNPGKYFYKAMYAQNLPYGFSNNPFDKDFCSYYYFNEVLETSKISPLKDL